MLYVGIAVAIVLVLVVVARLRRQTTDRARQFTDDPHLVDDPHRRHNQFDPATGVVVGGMAMHDAQHPSPSAESGGWGTMSDSSGSFDSGSGGSFDGGSSSVD